MFESILFCKQNEADADNPIDIGMLLECMLFYKHTHVVANGAILKQLLRVIGPKDIIALLEEHHLRIVFTEFLTAIYTSTSKSGAQLHTPTILSTARHTLQEQLRACGALTGTESEHKKIASWLESSVVVAGNHPMLTGGANQSLLDQDYLQSAIAKMLKSLIPGIGDLDGVEFNTEQRANGGISVHTNLDFDALNAAYHKNVPSTKSTLSQASLLTKLFAVEADLYLSCMNLSELATNPLRASLVAEKVGYLAAKRLRSHEELARFQDFVFDDAKAVREAVNSNKVDIADAVSVIRKSTKFKDWLANKDQEQDLVREYYKDVTRGTFIDKLPGKSARWVIFTGLGVAADVIATGGFGLASGIAMGVLDTFFIDNLIKGWKPSQFIEADVKKLLEEDKGG